MGEKRTPLEARFYRRQTRRQIFKEVLATAIILKAGKKAERRLVEEGITLSPPDSREGVVSFPESPLATGTPHADEKVSSILEVREYSGRLVADTRGKPMFTPTSSYKDAHRSGGAKDRVDKELGRNVSIFDTDANDKGGELYAEHGIYFRLPVKIFGKEIGFVFDRAENKLKWGKPRYILKDMVHYIASKSAPDNRLAMEIELKRGAFSEHTLNKLFDILQEENMPAILYSNDLKIMKRLESVAAKRAELAYEIDPKKKRFILAA